MSERLLQQTMSAFSEGEYVLAAVSGGADSVALLLLLCDLRDRGHIRLCAAHYEHGIRGEESLRDMRFVKELCERLNVPLTVDRGRVPEEAVRRGTGLEETARDLRRAFLRETMRSNGCGCIALAHHADDQAETVLMRLLRGTGTAGAAGMRVRSGAFVRPLLHIRKSELCGYLRERGQDWCEDSTNRTECTPRNTLRLRVMPVLEDIWPGAIEALGRFSAISAGESDYLDGLAADFLREHARETAWGICLTGRCPDGVIAARALRLLSGRDITAEGIRRITSVWRNGSGSTEPACPRFASACAREDTLWLLYPAPDPAGQPLREGKTPLGTLGSFLLEPWDGGIIRDDPYVQALDAEALHGASVRLWHKGDRVRPLGMQGQSRLVSDVYTDKKIPLPERRYLPVAVSAEGEILWAVGGCIAEGAKLRPGRAAVRVRWREAEPDTVLRTIISGKEGT